MNMRFAKLGGVFLVGKELKTAVAFCPRSLPTVMVKANSICRLPSPNGCSAWRAADESDWLQRERSMLNVH